MKTKIILNLCIFLRATNCENLVAGLHSVGNGLEANASSSQLENPHDPCNSENLNFYLNFTKTRLTVGRVKP